MDHACGKQQPSEWSCTYHIISSIIDEQSIDHRVRTDLLLVEHGDLDQDHGQVLCAAGRQVVVAAPLVPAWAAALSANSMRDMTTQREMASCSSGTTTAYRTAAHAARAIVNMLTPLILLLIPPPQESKREIELLLFFFFFFFCS